MEPLLFRPVDMERLEKARRAAKLCGQATAKVVNLYSANQALRVEAWELELAAWQRRLNESAHLLPHQAAVSEELDSLVHKSYTDNLIPPSDIIH
jgi:hypothetical protein